MTGSQYTTALARATETRVARSAVKRSVARGETTISEALEDPCCQKMTVFDLLCSQRRWGRDRTVRVLSGLLIGERRWVEELTDRQRSLLIQACEPGRVAA
jgi:hypothetical protein